MWYRMWLDRESRQIKKPNSVWAGKILDADHPFVNAVAPLIFSRKYRLSLEYSTT